MAGTLFGLALSQPVDLDGRPQVGCKLYIYEAGSFTTPVTAYKDFALTAGQEHPSPIPSDAWGRLPIFWLDDGNYAFRLVDADGKVLASSQNVQALGPSSGSGGGGSSVDPNALYATGDFIWQPISGTRSGFVRANGRTIGSATSGATERANSDCSALYAFLWLSFSDTICPVTSGRGVSASADFSANKPIQVPDLRGRSLFGLDDMGNSAASRLTGVPFSVGNATTAASLMGEATHTLSVSEMPAHDHGGVTASGNFNLKSVTGDAGSLNNVTLAQFGAPPHANTAHTHAISSQGGGQAHNITPLAMLGTYYIKL